MPTVIQPGFTSGEWSPYLEDRTDLEKYRSGCITLENFLLMSYGPVRRRPGTQHINTAAANTYAPGMFRFQFSASVGYVVEIGESLMWFYRNRARLVGVTATHPYLQGEFKGVNTAQLNDLQWFVHENHPVSKLTRGVGASITSGTPTSGSRYRIDANTGADFTGIGATENTVGTSFIANGGAPTWGTTGKLTLKGVVLSAGTPVSGTEYVITGNSGSTFTNIGAADNVVGTIFIANGLAPTWGTGEIQSVPWNFAEVEYKNPPFRAENLNDAHTIAVDGITGDGITLTANTDTFDDLHVGAYWRIGHFRDIPSVKLLTNPDNGGGAGGLSDELEVLGAWEVVTSGAWFGRVDLERSVAGGAYHTIRQWRARGNRNFTASGYEETPSVTYRLRFFYEYSKYSTNTTSPTAFLELLTSLHWGVVKITGVTNAKVATANVVTDLYSGAVAADATEFWAEGSWSDYRGYPKTVTLHEQRMIYGGNASEAQTVWGSDVDSYDSFTQLDSNDSDSFQYTVGSDEYSEIQWLATSPKNLMVGTTGGEWSFSSGSDESLITPTNVRARRESVWGAEHVQAISTNNVILFVEQGARKLRELAYSFEQDGFVSADLAQLSEHLTAGGIVDIAIQRHRDVVIWCVTGDGNLLSLTYDRAQNVVGWAKHTTNGSFESVTTLNNGGEEDEVWFGIKRVINGATVRHIESFYPDMWRLQENETQGKLFHVDDGIIQSRPEIRVHDGTDSTLWTGADVTGTAATYNSTTQAYAVAPATGTKSTEWVNPALNSIIEFDKGQATLEIAVDLYSAVTFYFYIDDTADAWETTDEIEVYLYSQGGAATVGTAVDLSDYAIEATVDSWQRVSIPMTAFAATGLTFDTLRFKMSLASATRPTFYIDELTIGNVSTSSSSVTSLTHLEGMTVQVLNKGAVEPTKLVASGDISTSNPADGDLIVGLGYTSTVEPLAWETSTEEGTSQGRSKRIHEAVVNIYKSGAFKVGNDVTQDQVYIRDTSDAMDTAPPLKTQQYTKPMPSAHQKRVKIRVVQEDPLPLTVISIAAKYRVLGD
jgi:hypothetical protein